MQRLYSGFATAFEIVEIDVKRLTVAEADREALRRQLFVAARFVI